MKHHDSRKEEFFKLLKYVHPARIELMSGIELRGYFEELVVCLAERLFQEYQLCYCRRHVCLQCSVRIRSICPLISVKIQLISPEPLELVFINENGEDGVWSALILNLNWQYSQQVTVAPYDPFSQGEQVYLGSMNIELSWIKPNYRTDAEFDSDILAKFFIDVHPLPSKSKVNANNRIIKTRSLRPDNF